MLADNKETRWTVYGRVRTGVGRQGQVLFKGFHADRLASREAAVHYVVKGKVTYGAALDAVVVRLARGRDVHGEREVIYREGEGRAWWE